MAELEIRKEDNVAWLTLNRPSNRNALSPALLGQLSETCAALASDEDTRVVVVRGAGGVFSAGADLMGFMASMHGDDPEAAADVGRLASEALMTLPQVTVAAIEGHCVGGGLVLASCCDLRWVDAKAWFSAPELDLGVPLAWGGLERLVAVLGDTLATEMVFTCRRLDAQEAHAVGFVSAPIRENFDEEIRERVAKLAAKPLGVLRTTKRQLIGIRTGTFEPQTDATALLAAMRDPESQRAAQAYFAKRAARSKKSKSE